MKYTKTDHMRYLDDGNEPVTQEAREVLTRKKDSQKNIADAKRTHLFGNWMQQNHRDIFNRDHAFRFKMLKS